MRRIAYIVFGLALVAATIWSCSADAPAPTPPSTGGGTGQKASPLQIRLFTSNANPVAGGCTAIQAIVTLNGVSVSDGTGVSFTTDLQTSSFQQNGLPLISAVTQNGAATTALCSTGAGLATVRANATVGTETGTATIAISFQAAPQVAPFFTFCSPSFGPPEGGTTLTINGGRFFGDPSTTRATFTAAGVTREALVSAVTATAVTLVTPAFPEATASSVPVAITLTFGTKSAQPATLSLPNCFAYGSAGATTPVITAILPSSGSNDGNTLVTIIGSGFVSPLQVFFGVVEAKVITVSFNQIVVLSPPASGAGLPNLNQNVTIRVHEVTSGLDATKAEAFRYVTALQITSIDNNQQRVDQPFSLVTIHGQGFLSPVAVTLAGIPAKVLSVTATELLVLPGSPFATACADITGPVVVTNIDSGDVKSGPNFTYQVAQTKPVIASVSPSVGQPGATVTITGANLGNITSVTFGGRPAPITSVSAGSVVVTVPDNGAPAPACPVGTPTGTPTNVGTAVDVVVTSALTGCSGTAASSFQYQLPCKPGADLAIGKTASPNPVLTGSVLSYTINVSNNGPNTATGVVVTDPLPGGTVFAGCTSTQGSCSLSGTTVIANLGDIPAPGLVSVRIQVTVTATGGTSIINTAVVSSATPDSNSANNSATVSTNVLTPTPTPNFADLTISKTASPNPVAAFGSLTYNITVGNNGPNTATNAVVNDPLPGGTTFVSCSSSQGTCSLTPSGSVVANLGDISSGGFAFVSIQVAVTTSGGGTITNSAFVSSSTPDPNNANNSASAATTVLPFPTPISTATPFNTATPLPTNTPTPTLTSTPTPTPIRADLQVTKTASSASVNSGSTLTYSVRVTNNGPASANNVVVNDPLPAGTTFVSCSTSQGTCLGPAVGINGTVSANLGTIPSPGFALVSIVVTVTAPGGSTITNDAVVSSSTADPVPTNNLGEVSTSVTGPSTGADLSIVKTDSPDPVLSGDNLTYTLSVHNGGPDPATGVTVTDSLPGGTTFVSCSASCVGPAVGTNGTVVFSVGNMAAPSNFTGTIIVKVNASGGSTLTNTAVVSSITSDPNPSNNSSTATTFVTAAPSADLSLTKSASPNPVLTGNNLTYTIQTTNNDAVNSAANVQVSDPLPPGTTFVSCATTQGTCTTPAVGTNGTVRADLGSVGPTASATVTIVVKVNAPGNSSITNTATVTSTTTDNNPSNNSQSVTTTVNP